MKKPLLIASMNFFANVGPKLACERSFEMYVKGSGSSFEEVTLSVEDTKT